MTVKLIALSATGPGKVDARVTFRYPATLVRGASDTGKSYIRDCLWYLLGGERQPKKIPQAVGYDSLKLEIDIAGVVHEIYRSHSGGEARLIRMGATVEKQQDREELDEDVGEFLVRHAGAAGKQLLRSRSKRGLVTGGDLRHWFLLSQPTMISEEPTAGAVVSATQRIAAFHMFLTGSDDSAFELVKTSKELERISGQIAGLEEALTRVRADLPANETRIDVANSLERVDVALEAMTSHYDARAGLLKNVRESVLAKTTELKSVELERSYSLTMVERFNLLDKKYKNDSERLGATWEGMAMFQALDEVPCPLCGTPAEAQIDPRHLRQGAQDGYRKALKAELTKIVDLRDGLTKALVRENERVKTLSSSVKKLRAELNQLEAIEIERVRGARYEFSGNPKTLAVRRSELSEQLAKFDDETQLIADIARLASNRKNKKVPLSRNVGAAASKVAGIARGYLHAWGFTTIQSIVVDADLCDLQLDGRNRLDFGAGKRAIFLTALTVAVMEHAIASGNPHLGFVVIDSPLKAYADPNNADSTDVDSSTVTDRFYKWLANWRGPGQVIILENQEIRAAEKAILDPIEFLGEGAQHGRAGFYPGE